MKNYLIAGLALLVVAYAYGLEPLLRVTNEAINRGTLRGAEKCIGYSESDLMSEDAVKARCTKIFQKRLYGREYVEGYAGPRIDGDVISWGGSVKNKTSSHVITGLEVSVGIYDEDGKEKVFRAETPIWIDPLGEAQLKLEVPELTRQHFEGIGFCEEGDETDKSCFDWGISTVMGLAL